MKLKPLGFRKMCKELNTLDGFPLKKIRKWKKGARQQAKRDIKKDIKNLDD